MAIRIRCSNQSCGQVFEDETNLGSSNRKSTAPAEGEEREITVFCHHCGKPTRVRLPPSQLGVHTIYRGLS